VTRFFPVVLSAAAITGVFGCRGTADDGARFRSIDDTAAVMWVRQTTTAEALLNEIVDAFNADRDGLPIKIEYAGDYGDIYRKVSASIQARTLPAMTVAYESMTTEFAATGSVRRLDDLIADPVIGMTESDLADYFPGVLNTNPHGPSAETYSFPFSKSVLVMYVNRRVLGEAGIEAPPRTWDEFLIQSRQIKSATGKAAYAIDIDCSTFDGFLMSMGGAILDSEDRAFTGPETLQALTMLRTMIDEDLAYLTPPRTFEDRSAFSQDQVAFFFRSSAHLAPTDDLMEGDRSAWSVAPIPQANPASPQTVLYGPNAVIFALDEAHVRTSWEFIRFFSRPENGVKWALGTGYVPIRKSAAELPELQAYWDEWECHRVPYDCLAFARPEPNRAGWQEVRGLVESTLKEVLTRIKSPETAAKELSEKATRVLKAAAL
jgi:multiple sugar transport system substrate-binding protein